MALSEDNAIHVGLTISRCEKVDDAPNIASRGKGVVKMMMWWTVRQLRSKNARNRKEAADKLLKLGRKGVDALISALKDSNPDARTVSCEYLLKSQDSHVMEALSSALNDSDKEYDGQP